jgi:hypothetical protein
MFLTALNIISVYYKSCMEAVWVDFSEPRTFYKAYLREQLDAGIMQDKIKDRDILKKKNIRADVLSKPFFWCEVCLLLLIPYPFRLGVGIPETVELNAVNYAEAPKVYVSYSMFIDDMLLSLMFLRFYFLIIGINMFAPTNASLYTKRAAYEAGFAPNFFFQLRANLARF